MMDRTARYSADRGPKTAAGGAQILNRATVGEQVADHLRTSIQRGHLPPGVRLLQSETADRFGVSQTPVREALALLHAEGLVKMDPHRGAIVLRPTLMELTENYRILVGLETMAIAEAVPCLTKSDLDRLQSLIDLMRETRSGPEWVDLNDVFHLTIYRASGMERLCSIIENLRDSCNIYFHIYVSSRSRSERSDDVHQAILDACASRDVRRAKALVRSHTINAMKELECMFKESGLPLDPTAQSASIQRSPGLWRN